MFANVGIVVSFHWIFRQQKTTHFVSNDENKQVHVNPKCSTSKGNQTEWFEFTELRQSMNWIGSLLEIS